MRMSRLGNQSVFSAGSSLHTGYQKVTRSQKSAYLLMMKRNDRLKAQRDERLCAAFPTAAGEMIYFIQNTAAVRTAEQKGTERIR